jgi:hypothetical protein
MGRWISDKEGAMISTKTMLAALGLAWFGAVGPLWAQYGPVNPVNRPAFSPYLNLNRPGTSAAVNYYGLVRPELQFRNALFQNQLEIAGNQQAISNLAAGPITTGHRAGFMTQWRYFMNSGVGAPTSAFRRSLAAQGGTSSVLPNVTRR